VERIIDADMLGCKVTYRFGRFVLLLFWTAGNRIETNALTVPTLVVPQWSRRSFSRPFSWNRRHSNQDGSLAIIVSLSERQDDAYAEDDEMDSAEGQQRFGKRMIFRKSPLFQGRRQGLDNKRGRPKDDDDFVQDDERRSVEAKQGWFSRRRIFRKLPWFPTRKKMDPDEEKDQLPVVDPSRSTYTNIQNTKGIKKRVLPEGFLQRQLFRIKLFIQSNITRRYTIYVLECEQGKWYVGSTMDRKKRYRNHFQSRQGGSKWTKTYRPLRVDKEYRRVPARYYLGFEAQVTAEYMLQKGVQNVRGAMFTSVREYTLQDLDALVSFLGHHNELDYQDLKIQLRRDLMMGSSSSSSRSGSVVVRPPPRTITRTTPTTTSYPQEKSSRKSTIVPDSGGDDPIRTAAIEWNEGADELGEDGVDRSIFTARRGTMPQPKNQRGSSSSSSSSSTRGILPPAVRVPRSTATTSDPVTFSFSGTNACFNCGQSGHYMAECPELTQTICFNCGGTGHFKANCPNLPRCFFCGEVGHEKFDCKKFRQQYN
jgi:hypothetical protein